MLAFLFDSVGFGEWFVLLAVVLVVVGPKNLPSAARKFGQYYGKFRRAADSFKRQILEADAEFARASADAEKAASDVFKIEGDPSTVIPSFDYESSINGAPTAPVAAEVPRSPGAPTAPAAAEVPRTPGAPQAEEKPNGDRVHQES